MVVIPFGVVGGVLGHMIMGMSLSIMSYMGMPDFREQHPGAVSYSDGGIARLRHHLRNGGYPDSDSGQLCDP